MIRPLEDPGWEGWRTCDGELWSPEGERWKPEHLRALPFLLQTLNERGARIQHAKARRRHPGRHPPGNLNRIIRRFTERKRVYGKGAGIPPARRSMVEPARSYRRPSRGRMWPCELLRAPRKPYEGVAGIHAGHAANDPQRPPKAPSAPLQASPWKGKPEESPRLSPEARPAPVLTLREDGLPGGRRGGKNAASDPSRGPP
jgi:hypothetical protein